MLPIKTTKDGETTTKVVVDDVYKMLNRIIEEMNKSYNESVDIIDSVHKIYDGFEGELIISGGVSQPCHDDKYDEKIGSEIAFRKAKTKNNLKKRRIIQKLLRANNSFYYTLLNELWGLESAIYDDIEHLRIYNPDYLKHLEL